MQPISVVVGIASTIDDLKLISRRVSGSSIRYRIRHEVIEFLLGHLIMRQHIFKLANTSSAKRDFWIRHDI